QLDEGAHDVLAAPKRLLRAAQGHLVAAHVHVGVRDRVLEGGQRLVILPEHLERAEVVGDGQLPLAHLGRAAGSRVEGVGHSSPSASFPPARTCACTWKDRKSTRLNSSHVSISYAVFC